MVLQLAAAHICFIAPTQRGAFNVSTPGDPSCYRRTDYCGSVAIASPLTTYVAGETITITLEQNLNHFFVAQPGYFDIAITSNLAPAPSDWTTLATWLDAPAFDMVSTTVYSVTATLPNTPSAHSILRARYVSNNKLEIDPPTNTQAIFYNCADIEIVAAPASVQRETAAHELQLPKASAPAAYNCTTPPVWSANFTEVNAWGFVQHSVWWNAPGLLTRWDKSGNLDASGPSSISLINDYSQPVEWVNFLSRGACETYGNDAFYTWQFGAAVSMTYSGRSATGVDLWSIPGGEASWLTEDLGDGMCKPIGWAVGQASVTLVSFDTSPIDPSVFKPAAACTQSPVFGGCHADAMRASWMKTMAKPM